MTQRENEVRVVFAQEPSSRRDVHDELIGHFNYQQNRPKTASPASDWTSSGRQTGGRTAATPHRTDAKEDYVEENGPEGWTASTGSKRQRKSRVRASGGAPPGAGYDWLMTADEPEMAIPVYLVFAINVHLPVHCVETQTPEATAENDLNCLLRQLQEVEQTMKQLEQDDGDFTRWAIIAWWMLVPALGVFLSLQRYSLASSSTNDRDTDCHSSPGPEAHDQGPQKSSKALTSGVGLTSSPLPPPSRANPQTTTETVFPSSPVCSDQEPQSPGSPLASPGPFSPASSVPTCMQSALHTTAQRCPNSSEYHSQKQQQKHNVTHTQSTPLGQDAADVAPESTTTDSTVILNHHQRQAVHLRGSIPLFRKNTFRTHNARRAIAPRSADAKRLFYQQQYPNLEDRPLCGSFNALGEQKVSTAVTDGRPVALNGATVMLHRMHSEDSNGERLLYTNDASSALSSHSEGPPSCHSNGDSLSGKSASSYLWYHQSAFVPPTCNENANWHND
ncbi:unnamed protein product [Schistocephalus solidus]|uniref:Transmembrane protein n=1 Tax=Schistocephalus solidus TaxID=70667 RepID=A0A183SHJ0_SCHSO|nr:unnamed protein product [Schistocephalus solidus]